MKIKIVNKVKDCPDCPCPDIKIEYESGTAKGVNWIQQTYVVRCSHRPVCKLRREP